MCALNTAGVRGEAGGASALFIPADCDLALCRYMAWAQFLRYMQTSLLYGVQILGRPFEDDFHTVMAYTET